jgi:hypothetical protein
MQRFGSKLARAAELISAGLLALGMSTHGAAKLLRTQCTLPPRLWATPVGQLRGLEITWAFFGYARPYAYFIGVAQILGGCLVCFRRTRLLGCALLAPILINIVAIDLLYDIPPGALLNATFYLGLTALLAWSERHALRRALRLLLTRRQAPRKRLAQEAAVCTLAVAIGFALILRYTGG